MSNFFIDIASWVDGGVTTPYNLARDRLRHLKLNLITGIDIDETNYR